MFVNHEASHISGAIEQWLSHERANADNGRNAYLSDYQDRRDDLFKPFDDPTNFQAQKAISHHGRITEWVRPYGEADLRLNDWFAGRLIFACLISVAGSYRKQCFFQSESEEDYFRLRYQKPADINLYESVSAEINQSRNEAIKGMSTAERTAYIVGRTVSVRDQSQNLHSFIHEWALDHMERKAGGVIATAGEPPVEAMRESQKLWCGLAAAHIAVAASFRNDDYAQVPVLEPKSISDAADILYPFAA